MKLLLPKGRIAVKFGNDIYVPHEMKRNNFGDALTFGLAPPGEIFPFV